MSSQRTCGYAVRGFTLMELMVVVALIGLIAGLAAYSIDMRRYYFLEAAREVYSTVNVARGQAVRRGVETTVYVHSNRIIAFIDANDNCVFDTGEAVLRAYPPLVAVSGFTYSRIQRTGTLPANMNIVASGIGLLDSPPNTQTCTRFDATGLHVDVTDEPRQANIRIVDTQNSMTRTLEISVAGALRLF